MDKPIKNGETQPKARELGSRAGVSVTVAVTEAVQEQLDSVRREKGDDLAGCLLAIGRDCAAHLKEPYRSDDLGDLLYDERGLPR